jgi:hypothetical protein
VHKALLSSTPSTTKIEKKKEKKLKELFTSLNCTAEDT